MDATLVIQSITQSNNITNQILLDSLETPVLDYINDLKNLNFTLPVNFDHLVLPTLGASVPYSLGSNFYGFKNHRRCFYKQIGDYWFAFKGASILYELKKRIGSSILYPSVESEEIHHFSESELEFPYGMTLPACEEDYQSPLSFINDFINEFGIVPLIPIPLFVFKLKNDLSIINQNKQFILSNTPESTKTLMTNYFFKEDLGIYVYVVKSSPVRVGFLNHIPSDLSVFIHTHTLDMVLKMFLLGYVPCKLGSIFLPHNVFEWGKNRGLCIAPWNISINGAIIDFNSVKSLKDYSSEREAKYDIQLSIQWVVKLIIWLDPKYSILFPKQQKGWIGHNQSLYNESLIYIQQVVFSYFKEQLKDKDIHIYLLKFFNPDLTKFEDIRLLQ